MIAGVLMTLLLQHLICGPRARTTNTRGRAGPIDALPPRPSPFPSVAARSRRGRPGITSMPGIASFVYSTIGIAYEKLGIFNKAIEYHTQHLAIAKEMGSWPTGGERARRTRTSASRIGCRGTSARPSSITCSAWRLQRRWATGRGRAGRTRTLFAGIGRRGLQQGHRVPCAEPGDCKGGGRPGGGGQGVREHRQRV